MKLGSFVRIVALCAMLLAVSLPMSRVEAASQPIFVDGLAAGWADWSWASVDPAAATFVHSGTHSIRVTYTGWQGLYLHHAGIDTSGYSALRFWTHGGASGGQQWQLYATRAGLADGPAVALPQPAAGAWTQVTVPLADLGLASVTLTGLVWQGTLGGAQPALYVDDIELATSEHPDGPTLSAGRVTPRLLAADAAAQLVVGARVADPQGRGDIRAVTLDASALGRGTVPLLDDGRHNDGAADDGAFGALLVPASGATRGELSLTVVAEDLAGHNASLSLGAMEVVDPPGGSSLPAALPPFQAGWRGLPAGSKGPVWGTNEWSESGPDWQVNSGVPWSFAYQYITYEWYTEGWGGDFVGRFCRQAWAKGFTPLISVYMFLAAPPNCGESPTCYATKLQNASTVSSYLAALQEAARQAGGTQPVIFQLEPDFYGYMQQLSNSAGRPSGVQPDDPSSYPVALNLAGYPNTLAGFGRRMVDVIHGTASNALVAAHASMWATNQEPHNVTAAEAVHLGERTAAFMTAMGADDADLLTVEWSDRDAGSGLRPWWDDTDRTLPRPTRALLWASALSRTAGKRLLLWQMPCGNMALDDSCDHYRDNRPAYAFSHPRELWDAGIVGVLFGGGAGCMTAPSTDGGFIAGQGALAYAPPPAPAGLQAGIAFSATVPLRWDEPASSTAPDLWGFRVNARPATGSPLTVDVGRANAASLLLPRPGAWTLTVSAYDAMGNAGPASAPVVVTTTVVADQRFLPLITAGY